MSKAKDTFDKAEFIRFCKALKVETKEEGIVNLGETLLDSQQYFVDEVFRGLSEGYHSFFCLKGRQLGITTICLALDLYWHFKFEGTNGTLVTDNEENKDMFRDTLTNYMDGLPKEWRRKIKNHNRSQLTWEGVRSRIVYLVAGSRKNTGFAAGKALMFLHATEVGKWGDVDLASLEASLAENNPHRLYIWESTAYGFGQWSDMWKMAADSKTHRQIFVGWWRNKFYRKGKDTEIYKVYWDGRLTEGETHWVEQVKEEYGFDIDDEQIAWWRWTLNEKMGGDEQQAFEKFPPTAEYAFVMTGSQFFSAQRLTDETKKARVKGYEVRRFVFGGAFEDTELVECNEKTATLKIWEVPVAKGQYVIGADPAWGSSEWADRFCVCVTRVWADGMEQVAEFCTPDMNTTQYAWVLLYLAGAYGDRKLGSNIMINLEINGPGQAVWTEIQQLKQRAFAMRDKADLAMLLANIEQFLYRRPDSVGGGYAYHTKTSANEKERYLNLMKDAHEMGLLTINSVECMAEMRNVVRHDGMLGVPGRGKDDRVISQALAVLAWHDFVRMRLIRAGITREKQRVEADMPPAMVQAGRSIETYLKTLSVRPEPPRMGRGRFR